MTAGLGDGLAVGLGDELALGPGDGLALGLAGRLTLGLGKLPIAFLTLLPHPAAMHPAARIAAERARPRVRRMPRPSARTFPARCLATTLHQ